MGVIKKVLFRGDILGKPRHRNMFLDMEENIHIHYRDMRIELSRGEFEDIAKIFSSQSAELLAIIEKTKYQDGTLPNANQDDVRIWTESRLNSNVKYHPQRFSLEECGDGYHFHFRNYKLLIDRKEFSAIARVFASMDMNSAYAETREEVLDLLKANELDFRIISANQSDSSLSIAVAPHHLPKVRDIFGYIGFVIQPDATGTKCYVGKQLKVMVSADDRQSPQQYRQFRAYDEIRRLADYLGDTTDRISADEINLIKCQVLNLYHQLLAGEIRDVELDPGTWLYSSRIRRVIFPHAKRGECTKQDAERMYRAWADMLRDLDLAFIKPAKDIFTKEVQDGLWELVSKALRRDVAAYALTHRAYVMGSALRKEMGQYRVPFVHGKLAKLGSDVDVLIVLEPKREQEIPKHWKLHLAKASNGCAVYHVGQIPLAGEEDKWRHEFPSIPFIPHLLDAYVFFPSWGNKETTEAFLKKFGAQVLYDRDRDGAVFASPDLEEISATLVSTFGLSAPLVEPLKASSENTLYSIVSDQGDYVLKLFKAAGNHHKDQIAAHTAYESLLVSQLVQRGIPTARVISSMATENNLLVVNGHPSILFERIPGAVQQKPDYPMAAVCASLASIHSVQLASPLDLTQGFSFDQSCMIWLPAFERYTTLSAPQEEISAAIASLQPIAAYWFQGEHRAALFDRSPSVHCHGDVTPKNFILDPILGARFFDFNNAFYGPRLADVIDGAYEFSLAEKYIHLADFSRFDQFINLYDGCGHLSSNERLDLQAWTELVGIIKFSKEIRVFLERPKEHLRRKRALAISKFLLERCHRQP